MLAGPKKEAIFMKPEQMEQHKLTMNTSKSIKVDLVTPPNIISTSLVRCSILNTRIVEYTEYLVLKTKYLVLKIDTKIDGEDEHWIVRRTEADFYVMRNILCLAYGQCIVPPLTPSTREQTYDKKSLYTREKKFSRFLRSIL